jgi:CheY-like chemotaxis protein
MSKSRNEYRIYVVDDEPIISETLGQILRQKGFEVSCFTDPLKGLEAVHLKAPDFLITDVVMPEMSGIDLAIVIRETCPHCTVLLFSGQIITTQLLEAARDRGHNFDVLTKPVPPANILERVFMGLGIELSSNASPAKLFS